MQKKIKLKRAILLLLMIVLSVQIKAQVISTDVNILNGLYEMSLDEYSEDYSQKILNWGEKQRIGLTKTNHDEYQFFMLTRGVNTVSYVKLNSEYVINDFTILGDTLYFCGHVIGDRNDSLGFIAYTNIYTMFGSPHFSFSLLNTNKVGENPTYEVRKIRAYYNSNNEKIVVGIGSMYYGDPTRDILDINSSSLGTSYIRTRYPKLYYDYLMLYKITETPTQTNIEDVLLHGVTPIYEPANEVIFYRNPINVDSLDHAERFQDITLMDNSICLISTSTYYEDSLIEISTHSSSSNGLGHDDMIFIRKIDKNNYNIQEAKVYMTNEQIHPSYGFRVETLDRENIAIGRVICDIQQSQTKTIIDQINISDNNFSFINSFVLDTVQHREYVLRNIEYEPMTNSLLVLKSVIGHRNNIGAKNNVFLFDLNNNQVPYPIRVRDLSQPVYQMGYPVWNDIRCYEDHNYYCIGSMGGKLKLSDVRLLYDKMECNTVYDIEINNQREYNLIDDNILRICRFEAPTLSVLYGVINPRYFSSTTTYKAVVMNKDFNEIGEGYVEEECITKE